MYSALRRENPTEPSSSSEAAASRARDGNAQTRPTGSPKRSTSRLRIATAAKRETCCAVIDVTSASNGSGASAGRKPAKRTTSGASSSSPAAHVEKATRSNSKPSSLRTTGSVSASSGSTSTAPSAAAIRTSRPPIARYSAPSSHTLARSSPKARKRAVVSSSENGSGAASSSTASPLQVRGETRARGVGALGRLVAVLRVRIPRAPVRPVVEVARERRQPQRVERVAHHGELVGLVHPDRLLGKPGLRPVRQPRRMERDRSDLDALARAEVAGDVIDHLLRLQVRVVVRDRHREWVEVELPRAERADHEVPAGEGLVGRRRLVDAAGDRLEVVDRERPRVEVAVPADDVERVVVDDVGLVAAADADLDRVLAVLAHRVQLGRWVDVAVVVRRALHQLAVLVPVAARDLDQPRRLEDEIPLRALGLEAVRRAARHHDIVAFLVGQLAEDRLERPRPFVDEDDLVALAVTEEVVHRPGRPAERDLDVVVPHQDAPAGDLVALGRRVERLEVAVPVLLRHPLVALDRLEAAELHDAAGGVEVVEDRLVAGEALEPHHLFGEERSVLPELDVALARDVAEALVERHPKTVSGTCSRVLALEERVPDSFFLPTEAPARPAAAPPGART